MILKNNIIGNGWIEKFNPRLEILFKIFPDTIVESIQRFKGMLRIRLIALDKDTQFILDSVTYKIERESAKACELCGKSGKRITDESYFSEERCLCWKCYAMEIDSMELHNRM